MPQDVKHDQSTQVIEQIPIARIQCRPQVRRAFDESALATLAASIKEIGVQQPIRVRREGDTLILVIGERRLRATQLAGLETIPAIIVDGAMTAAEIDQVQFVENFHRSDLTAREKSATIQRLLTESKWTAAQVAIKLGLSAATVTKLQSLNTLPGSILACVDAGTISLSAAYELSQVKDPARQAELATQTAAGDLPRAALIGAKKAAATSTETSTKSAIAKVTAHLTSGRSMTFAGPGLDTVEHLIAWLKELLAKANRARPQSLTLGTFLKMLCEQARP